MGDGTTTSIHFRYAIGHNMVLSHHKYRSNKTYSLTFVQTSDPTNSPTVEPTTNTMEPTSNPTMEPTLSTNYIIPPSDEQNMSTVYMVILFSILGCFCLIGAGICYKMIKKRNGLNHQRLNDGIEFRSASNKWTI